MSFLSQLCGLIPAWYDYQSGSFDIELISLEGDQLTLLWTQLTETGDRVTVGRKTNLRKFRTLFKPAETDGVAMAYIERDFLPLPTLERASYRDGIYWRPEIADTVPD